MLAQGLTECRVKQMCRCVIAHGGLTDFFIDHRIDQIADVNFLFNYNFMRSNTLHRLYAAINFRHNDAAGFVIAERPDVSNLTASIRVEGSTIEENLTFLPWKQLLDTDSIFHNCENTR